MLSWCFLGAERRANILSLLYKSIIMSYFDYSSLAFVNSHFVHRLDVIQIKALRTFSGAMEVETKIIPLMLRRILLIEIYRNY